MMKLIKIDGYWIVVSEPREGELCYYKNGNSYHFAEYRKPYYDRYDFVFGVIFSQNPEHNLHTITFSDEVAKELGDVDVEKLAEKEFPLLDTENDRTGEIEEENYQLLGHRKTYKKAYNQCLSDNADKKFTLEDIKKAFNAGSAYSLGSHELMEQTHPNLKEYIQSLTKEEYFCEVEMCCGKYTKCNSNCRFDGTEKPLIKENSCKVIKIWK